MRPPKILRWIALAALALFPVIVPAQQLPGAGSFPDGVGAEGHGWVVVGRADEPMLVHVPPRGSVDVGGGRRLSGHGGTVRLAARLNSMPEAIACRGREVFLVFPPAGVQKRLVLRASVSPAPIGNLWEVDQKERLDAFPSLDAPGRLVGVEGTDLGLAALLAEGRRPATLSLYVLRGREWVICTLPSEVTSTGDIARLVSVPRGIGLYSGGSDGRGVFWLGATEGVEGAIRWTGTSLPSPGEGFDPGMHGAAWVGGGVVFGVDTDEGLSIRQVRPSGVYTLAEMPGVGPRHAMCPMPQSGRVTVVWTEPKPGAPAPDPSAPETRPEERIVVSEASVFTGRVLYSGPPAEAWPFSVLEFRLLALLLVAIVVGVLLFVLRPDHSDGVVLLPRSTALAEPWRRALAGAVDVAVAWLVVSSALGVTLESLMLPVFGARLVPIILMVMVTGCAHCTLSEWLFGRTFGKIVSGCRVVQVGVTGEPGAGSEGPRHPTFREALIRNVLRWAVPPLGIAALAAPGARHRGDILAKTAVVVMVEAEDDVQS